MNTDLKIINNKTILFAFTNINLVPNIVIFNKKEKFYQIILLVSTVEYHLEKTS